MQEELPGSGDKPDVSKTMAMFDKALIAANKVMAGRVNRLQERHPGATPDQLAKKLETSFLSSVTATGAATGGAAALPGAGTAASLAMSAGDASWFMTAAAGHILSVLRVHGVNIEDFEHQKAIVLTVLAGGGGSTFVGKAAGRTGGHLGRLFANNVPITTIRAMNKVLGVNFVTRYGTRQGVLVLGRAAPFGIGVAIGAGGNLFFGQAIVKATRKAVTVAHEVKLAE